MVEQIQFYEPNEQNGFLSNFSLSPILLSDVVWATSEHYYQAQKFTDPNIQREIRLAQTPDYAFKLSRQYEAKVKSDWMDVRHAVMRYIVFEKFRQHNHLIHLLVSTGNKTLIEHSHKDHYWGDGGDGTGQNELGKILMEVRKHFAEIEPYNLVRYVDSAKLPTQWGIFHMYGFVEQSTGKEHLALVYGNLDASHPPLIRLHSECLTGDALFSARCDCGFQLARAMQNIVNAGSGILLYLRQEGRGIGLINKIRAYHLQDDGADTVEANEALGFAADMRDYSFCRGMLSFLNVKSVRLMTNNPRKVQALENANIDVVERVPLQEGNNQYNHGYLNTKATKLGHMFDSAFIK
ncbi:GTP cyclohydrolase II [Photobacterium nomapromontoriensis]|uniref:GTP cyclohydrolase II n=1 Tax=Photobacterium nomapromontoriensis TaxID=2910237 RepID=UPI003D14A0A1